MAKEELTPEQRRDSIQNAAVSIGVNSKDITTCLIAYFIPDSGIHVYAVGAESMMAQLLCYLGASIVKYAGAEGTDVDLTSQDN